jgi:hypothetical protein
MGHNLFDQQKIYTSMDTNVWRAEYAKIEVAVAFRYNNGKRNIFLEETSNARFRATLVVSLSFLIDLKERL